MVSKILLNIKEKFSSEEIKNYLSKICEKSSFEIFECYRLQNVHKSY